MIAALNIYTWQDALTEWYVVVWFVGYVIVLTMLAGGVVLLGLTAVIEWIEWIYAWLTKHTYGGRRLTRGA